MHESYERPNEVNASERMNWRTKPPLLIYPGRFTNTYYSPYYYPIIILGQ